MGGPQDHILTPPAFRTPKLPASSEPQFRAIIQLLFWIYGFPLWQTLFWSETKECSAVAQWLRCCATIRKVAGSIPAGVSGFFFDIKSFWSHYVPGVDSASNRNEYQENFVGVKVADA